MLHHHIFFFFFTRASDPLRYWQPYRVLVVAVAQGRDVDGTVGARSAGVCDGRAKLVAVVADFSPRAGLAGNLAGLIS